MAKKKVKKERARQTNGIRFGYTRNRGGCYDFLTRDSN